MTFLQTTPLSKTNRQICLLLLAVVALYCRALWDPIVSIDDAGIMKFYSASQLTLLDVLRPGQGYYYRPLIALSYYFDYQVLGQNTALMHLENILIHAANAVLLLLLAFRLFPVAAAGLPLIAALVFAAHPVNCEAVSWIAGRTDPLAGLFVLLSALSLCKGLETGKVRHTVLSVMLLLTGLLAKETALLFIPVSLLLVAGWRHFRPDASPDNVKLQARVLCLLYLGICLLFAVLLFSRSGAHNSVAKLLTGNKSDAVGSLLLCLKVFGFYLKKMLVPWPLNFAILTIADWYLIPAAAGLLFLWFVPKRNPYFICVASGFLFLLPAVVVALFDVAWTAVAERYLYIPSAFLAVGLTGYLHLAAQRMRLQHLVVPVLSLGIAVAAVSTVHRTGIWQSNLALFQDTVAQTPDFGMLHNELAVALARAGRVTEAEKELDAASSLDISDLVKGLIRRNRLLISVIRAATPDQKRSLLNRYGWNDVKDDAELLTLLRQNDYLIIPTLRAGAQKDALVTELIEVSERLFSRTGEPLLLYNNGQLLLERGDRRSALAYFARCAQAAPDGAYYKAAAGKLAATLGREP